MVNHKGLTAANFWSPPGGGLNFGETAQECLTREFEEETRIKIDVKEFLFACELMHPPLHAIELFFKVDPLTLEVRKGVDPEPNAPKIINEVSFVHWKEITMFPKDELHGIFRFTDHPLKVVDLRGYFKL
ncbi:hypothetical protein WSM22_44480 [Cytophagales bacterium WSM2-2]|nr:hypothetical protein WSM22_44480 [Cytophagales bacterium WSM2-2]